MSNIQSQWKCTAAPRAAEPVDCGWPDCGCDPNVERVVTGLRECGWTVQPPRVVAWDAPHNRSYEPVENLAKQIYDGFLYDGVGTKPAWTPGGNGTKQDQARQSARAELRGAGHVPVEC